MESCFNISLVVIQSLQNVLNTGVHGHLVSVFYYYNGFIQRALLTRFSELLVVLSVNEKVIIEQS